MPMNDSTVLGEALSRSRAAGASGLVVFDLDSTLLDNRPRQARILAEYGKQYGLPALEGAQAEHFCDWSLAAAMRRAGVSEPDIERHREPARTFWRERFFTSEYCEFDRLVVGASQFVGAVESTGAQIAY